MPLGEVAIDSGLLLIVDPCHAESGLDLPEDLADLIPGEAPGVPVTHAVYGTNVAVAAPVPGGDAVHPVYLLKAEGEPVGLFVDFRDVRELAEEDR